MQRTLGSVVQSTLKELFDWDVSVGRVRLGLWNRVIINDLHLLDKQDSTLLYASRLAAKIDILPLLTGQISIANVQLFGTQVNIYQASPEEKPNFQFLIDTFSSNDTTSSSIDLRIGSILLRRVSVNWHQCWKPRKAPGTLDPAHLKIKDIAVTAHLKTLTSDSLNVSLKRLSFSEECGLALKNLSFDLVAGQGGGELKNFKLQLPHSTLSFPSARASWPELPRKGETKAWLKDVSVMASPTLSITPSDLAALTPMLRHADTPIQLQTTVLLSEGCLNVHSLNISDGKSADLSAKAFVFNIIASPEYSIVLERLSINPTILHSLGSTPPEIFQKATPYITRLDTFTISGKLHFTDQAQDGSLHLDTKHGTLNVQAIAKEWNNINATVSSTGLAINKILSDDGRHVFGNIAFNISATADIAQKSLEAKADIQESDGSLLSHLTFVHSSGNKLTGSITLDEFPTERLGLGKRYPGKSFSTNTTFDLCGSNLDDIEGHIGIQNFAMQNITNLQDESEKQDTVIAPLDIAITTNVDGNGHRKLDITSAPLNVEACGNFRFNTISTTIINGLHNKLPQLIPHKNVVHKADTLHFSLSIQDTTLLRQLALQNIAIPQKATLQGDLYGYDSLRVYADIPELKIGKELLRNSKISIYGTEQNTQALLSSERLHKKGFVSFAINADAHNERLRLIVSMDNNRSPRIGGEMDITTSFLRDDDGELNVRAWIAPTDFAVCDTVWKIHPCAITWDGKIAEVRDFKVNHSTNHGIGINGRVSASEEDTLTVNLKGIDVEYILDLVNFNAVEFDGVATGSAYATGLMSSPKADIDLTVNNFAFNNAPLGTLRAKANWGDTPNFLSLDATIADPGNLHLSTIGGGFHIGNKQIPNGLDLKVNTQRFNLAFINFFTKDIFENFHGRASGYCRIYGPFSGIELQGDMMINQADFTLPMLGTSYKLHNDSVHIRPKEISITALLCDKNAVPFTQPIGSYTHTNKSTTPHTAVLNGRLTHRNFKNLCYDFRVNANKFLGFDFKEFGESAFYATCIVSGDIAVEGMPGRLSVNINATPEQGTVFTYNVATPDALTDADFITIGSLDEDTLNTDNAHKSTDTGTQDANSTADDMYLDFDLNLTPAAKLRLLMDRKSGDMIEINGDGRIRAKYYNKGRFNIYGTYHVQDGTYHLSLQEIIRKDFKFQSGGTIIFGGDAMKADLNLKAVYSVNSVSLDDLTTSSMGFSKTRVNCIMNLTGSPEHPSIAFDFELPNATEDEEQMVRSIVSTEEERNMQAIYLLGLGRFYNSGSDGATQSSAAMNSLVSSTLSSHLNNLISTAVGSRNWQVNAFLQTTEDGWRNMDVEGQLSGSLLDDRLLLTGNFGYREKYYTQRNFISDVTVEYLLTRNGMLSLKAYNKANDRYFVQSTLNTQGIGIQYKRDFNNLFELFQWLKKKRKEEK